MAKFEEPFKDTQEIFDNVIATTVLERNVNIKILSNNKLKEIGKVVKANELLKYMTSNDVVILLNEVIFEQLTEAQKTMVAEELIAAIHFDIEKDKLIITKPDLMTYSLLLRKWTFPTYEILQESIKTLFHAKQEAEETTNA